MSQTRRTTITALGLAGMAPAAFARSSPMTEAQTGAPDLILHGGR